MRSRKIPLAEVRVPSSIVATSPGGEAEHPPGQ